MRAYMSHAYKLVSIVRALYACWVRCLAIVQSVGLNQSLDICLQAICCSISNWQTI